MAFRYFIPVIVIFLFCDRTNDLYEHYDWKWDGSELVLLSLVTTIKCNQLIKLKETFPLFKFRENLPFSEKKDAKGFAEVFTRPSQTVGPQNII